jgi:hypothetical protein
VPVLHRSDLNINRPRITNRVWAMVSKGWWHQVRCLGDKSEATDKNLNAIFY